jgi:Leucine-rich repeat (LRR) protein
MNKLIRHTIVAFSIAFLAVPAAVQAERVEPEKAEKIALRFAESKQGSQAREKVRLKHTAVKRAQRTVGGGSGTLQHSPMPPKDDTLYYVFNMDESANGGFVIISADDVTRPVLGYSANGNYNENYLPPNFAYWMDYLQEQIVWAQENDIEQSDAIRQEWNSYIDGNMSAPIDTVGPLIKTKWNQGAPYNNMCPIVNGKRSATGCLATAMAQIMNYYKHPLLGSGERSYTSSVAETGTLSVNFGTTAYDWENMRNTYPSSTDSAPENNAVATLMFHAGVSVNISYNPSGSTGFPDLVPGALKEYFGYNSGSKLIVRFPDTDNTSWDNTLRAQIDAGIPVLYGGQSQVLGGHSFICDGYTGDGYFHFNWGWGGDPDGFFLSALVDSGPRFNMSQHIIINIKPGDITYKFPDANFRQAIYEHIGKSSGDPIYYSDVDTITVLNIENKGIESLTGIENLIALKELNCGVNKLTSLDLPRNTKLTKLICNNNLLTKLNVSEFTALTELDCSNNKLSLLNILKNTALTKLDCSGNDLAQLDVSNNTALTKLFCYNNVIVRFDFEAMGDEFYFTEDESAVIGFTKEWDSDKFKFLPQKSRIDIAEKFIDANFRTEVYAHINDYNGNFGEDPAYIPKIYGDPIYFPDDILVFRGSYLYVPSKNISSLAGIEYLPIEYLSCDNNNLTELDLSNNTGLWSMSCSNNQLTSLTFSPNAYYRWFTWLGCSNNKLTSLDVSNLRIEGLWCDNNNLSTLKLGGRLEEVYCSNNNLTSLDLSGLDILYILKCSNNKLIELDLTGTRIDIEKDFYYLAAQSLPNNSYQNMPYDIKSGLDCRGNYLKNESLVIGFNREWDDENYYFYPQKTHKATATVAGPLESGTVSISGSGEYFYGDNVTVSAMPGSGYVFDNWAIGGYRVVSSDTEYTFTMGTEDVELAAYFVKTYKVIFVSLGDTIGVPQIVKHGTTALPPTLTREGYTLVWDEEYSNVTQDMTVTAQWVESTTTAVQTRDRTIPNVKSEMDITPSTAFTSEFTAGPNPATKSAGTVGFFRQGKRIYDCELRIYDASGNFINKVKIRDKVFSNKSRHQVGSWNLKDSKGRQVAEGTYVVKGVIKTADGNREKVSVILGIR